VNDTIQVIGDVDSGKLVIKSFQQVPNLDTKLFEEVLQQRRGFLQVEDQKLKL